MISDYVSLWLVLHRKRIKTEEMINTTRTYTFVHTGKSIKLQIRADLKPMRPIGIRV